MMMTDQELLELAAEGCRFWSQIEPGEDYGILVKETKFGEYRAWNPLEDDGDALRLAVATNQAVFMALPHEAPTYAVSGHSKEEFGSDRNSAVRRAIVREAAEIGKAKP